MQNVNPFNMTSIEFNRWLEEQDRKRKELLSLLNHLKHNNRVIASLWRVNPDAFYIVSQSAKKPHMIQLTLFKNNEPIFDMCRIDFEDIADELIRSNSRIEQINHIN